MLTDQHDLVSELPEHKDAIHELKVSNNHFARLLSEYNELDKDILHAEEEIDPTAEAELEEMKKRRLALKDELFAMIQEHEKAA